MKNLRLIFKKAVASFIAATLLVWTPGLPCYQAIAASNPMNAEGGRLANVSGVQAGGNLAFLIVAGR